MRNAKRRKARSERVARLGSQLAPDVNDRCQGEVAAARRVASSWREWRKSEQRRRHNHVLPGYSPRCGRFRERCVSCRVDPESGESVVTVLRRAIARARRVATVADESVQRRQSRDESDPFAPKELGVQRCIGASPCSRRLAARPIAVGDVHQQASNGVTACNHMIVRDAKMKVGASVDSKKPEWIEFAIGCESDVKLPLHLLVERYGGIRTSADHVELSPSRASAPDVTAAAAVELETNQAALLQRGRDHVLQARSGERFVDAKRMHGAVRIELAPAQHHRLEKIEPMHHPPLLFASSRAWRARISFCASMHQCFLTLYQISAACTMLDVSIPASSGGAVPSPGRYWSIHARVSALSASAFALGMAIWLVEAGSTTVRTWAVPVAWYGSLPNIAIGSHSMMNPVNSSTLSGIARSRLTISHWPNRTRSNRPVASDAA